MDDARPQKIRQKIAAAAGLALCLGIGAALAVALAVPFTPRGIARFEAAAGARRERARDAGAARARLLAGFARDAGGAESMAGARRGLRTALAAALPAQPLPALSPGAACAARLRGLALALRGLVRGSPAPARGASPEHPELAIGTLEALRTAAAAADVASLDAALAAELDSWGRALRDLAAALAPRGRSLLWARWRNLLESRAAEFEFLAAEREAAEPARMRPRIAPHAVLRALALEPRIPDPSAALAEYPAEPPQISIRPLPGFWAGVAFAGALGGAALFAAARALRRRRDAPAPFASPVSDPGDERSWLHVVTGGNRARIGRAVCELAAHPLARRQRVVVVDASRRLRLNELLRLSPRLGFIECVTQSLPALGLLQSGGFTGLFLLARGRRGRVTDWLPLDRVLEELRPHFARVILVFEDNIPAVVGGVLAGRIFTGWWAGPGPAAGRAGARASEWLAIALADLMLGPVPTASLESLEERLVALAGVVRLEPRISSVSPAGPAVFRVSAPAVLDCDLQIRQKLRFLAWTRRIRQTRTEREDSGTTGSR